MPTKLNHAGNQQNYVPAGHGDASGEYGDNDTGSNIHIQFKKFEKPNKDIKVDIKQNDGKEVKNDNSSENKKEDIKVVTDKAIDYVSNHSTFNKKVKETLKDLMNNADEDCIRALNEAYSNNEYEFKIGSGVFAYGGILKVDKADFDEQGRIGRQGEVWFHENGHLFDHSKNKDGKWLSTIAKDENGKTLHDLIKEELDEKIKNNELSGKIFSEEVNKLTEKYFNESEKPNVNVEETYNKYKEYKDKYDKQYGEIRSEWLKDNISYETYHQRENEIKQELEEEYKDTIENYKKLESLKLSSKKKARNELSLKYSAISDAYGAVAKISYGLGIGHSYSYYKSRPEYLEIEFFANCFSAKAGKDKASIETIKKYAPKSYALFEKILKGDYTI